MTLNPPCCLVWTTRSFQPGNSAHEKTSEPHLITKRRGRSQTMVRLWLRLSCYPPLTACSAPPSARADSSLVCVWGCSSSCADCQVTSARSCSLSRAPPTLRTRSLCTDAATLSWAYWAIVLCSDTTAQSYLEQFSWDLMRAVDEFYANGGLSGPSKCVVPRS